MIIDISNIEVFSLRNFDLEKAGFKHGYYTHLVPKKVRGKDGVERIHWVNPDPGKKAKLSRITHFSEGKPENHKDDIKRDHEIKDEDMVRFSEGDKVEGTKGKHKGLQGVLRGPVAGPTPRVSVAFHNAKTDKHEAKILNVNDIKLVHRADDATKKVIERKTVEVTNIKGETILVDRSDYEKYYKDREKRKSPKQNVEDIAKEVIVGGTYQRPDGRSIVITSSKKMLGKETFNLEIRASKDAKPTKGKDIDSDRLKRIVEKQGYKRVPRAALLKAAGGIDPKNNKPFSIQLETGELHEKGAFQYDAAGYRVASTEDEVIARNILAEHWVYLQRVVASRVMKYPAVSEGDITPADIMDGLIKGITTYEPLLDTGGGIKGRLEQYADAYAKSEAVKIQERENSTVRDDFADDTDTKIDPTSAVDKGLVKEVLGDTNDIIASAFISKEDAILLDEGLTDETDMMQWLYENEQVIDIMKRWTGLGEFESTLTKKEAAAELFATGLVKNPSTGEPYKASSIEVNILPKELIRIKEAFEDEAAVYPDFMATLKKDRNLRQKLSRNRKILPAHPKDAQVMKVTLDEVKKPASRAKFAAKIKSLGVPLNRVGAVMQLADRILAGRSVPTSYAAQLPRDAWEIGSKALTQWFKETLPPSVFMGKRAAALNLPRRFDIETPIKEAIAREDLIKEELQQAAGRVKYHAKMGLRD